MHARRLRFIGSLSAAAMFAAPVPAAQIDAATNYLSKPIRIVVPFAPGGNIDINARSVAPGLSEDYTKWVRIRKETGIKVD